MATRSVIFKILFLVLIAQSNRNVKAIEDEERDKINDNIGPMNEEDDNKLRRRQDLNLSLIIKDEKKVSYESEKFKYSDPSELCYLSNGGSSLKLTVNEATKVGSIVGTLDVNGNPSLEETGNIDLTSDLNLNSNSNSSEPFSASSFLTQLSANHPERRVVQRRWAWWPQSVGGGRGNKPTTSQVSAKINSRPPIELEPGTKNIILVRELDKESNGVDEENSSMLLNVKCQPRNSAGERTIIPIRLIVTDANDNAPQFVGQQPYRLNISEATPVGSIVTREIQAIDRDSAGPHSTIHYRIEEDGSPHAHLLHFPNPLEPALYLAAQLDYETIQTFTLTILAQDQGEPEPLVGRAQIQVNVIDSDDQNPKFLDDKYTLVMDETQRNSLGQRLKVEPRNLRAQDGDKSIEAPILYSFEEQTKLVSTNFGSLDDIKYNDNTLALLSNDNNNNNKSMFEEPSAYSIDKFLHLSKSSGEIRLLRQWPASDWSARPLTLVVRATQADNRDRYALTTLTILTVNSRAQLTNRISTSSTISNNNETRKGNTFGLEFVSRRVTLNIPENVAINEKIGNVRAQFVDYSGGEIVDLVSSRIEDNWSSENWTLNEGKKLIRKERQQQPTLISNNNKKQNINNNNNYLESQINYQILDDQTDQFGVNQLGEIILKRTLDYEQRQEFSFRILATLARYSDICHVLVNVINLNDNKPKFTHPQFTFHLSESRLRQSNGLIGSVLATDSDINDTLSYSLLPTEFSHLFQLNSSSGQLSLRRSNSSTLIIPPTIGQNSQLLVQVTDSLGPKWQHHNRTARVNLLIAAQLVGRSLSIQDYDSDQQATSTSATITTLQQQQQQQHHRSSLATVMSSLEHMLKSVTHFEVPLPSALLLSALLALLICLLFVLLVAMSVHFYRRQSKLRTHRHQLMAATLAQATVAHFKPPQAPSSLTGPNQQQQHQRLSMPNNSNNFLSSAKGIGKNGQGIGFRAGQISTPVSLISNAFQSAKVAPSSGEDNDHYLTGVRGLERIKKGTYCGRRRKSNNKVNNNSDNSLISTSVCSSSKESSERTNMAIQAKAKLSGRTNEVSDEEASIEDDEDDDSSVIKCGHYSLRQDSKSLTFDCCGSQAFRSSEIEMEDGVMRDMSSDSNKLTANNANMLSIKTIGSDSSTWANNNHESTSNNLDPLGLTDSIGGRSQANGLRVKSYRKLNALNSPDSENFISNSQSLLALIKGQPQTQLAQLNLNENEQLSNGSSVQIRWPEEAIPQRVKRLTWDDELSSIATNSNRVTPNNIEQLNCPLQEQEQEQQQQQQYQRDIMNHNIPSPMDIFTPNMPNSNSHLSNWLRSTASNLEIQPVSSMGEIEAPSSFCCPFSVNGQDNNCFDYTIVQSSQFHVDSLAKLCAYSSTNPLASSINNQHHLHHHHQQLQQQQQPRQQHAHDNDDH